MARACSVAASRYLVRLRVVGALAPGVCFIGTFRVGRWWLPSAQVRVQLPTDLPPRGVKGLHGLGKTQVLKLIQH